MLFVSCYIYYPNVVVASL